MLRHEILTDPVELQEVGSQWDSLAVACARPFCAPAWMLAWWRHVAPADAKLRTIVVLEGDELVGIAPFFALSDRIGLVRYRMLGSRTSARLEPLARRGAERLVAEAVAVALVRASPNPGVIVFEGIPTTSVWPELLGDLWPGQSRPYRRRAYPTLAPVLGLGGRTFDEWYESRPSHFRQEVRRRRRRLDEQGAVFSMAQTKEEVTASLESFSLLHHQRWEGRGGSAVLSPQVEAMLRDAGRHLVDEGRLRLWSIEIDGAVISSQLFVAAGGEVAYWLGGFDRRYARLGPSIQGVLQAVRDAWKRADVRLDLGAGPQDYKYSFADGQDVLEWVTLAPRTRRYPLTRLQLVPNHLRETVSKRLSPESREKLRRRLPGRLTSQ
jgi:CelD/BcsL family acetyltransferase involved in cellulose biosynthesis